MKGFSALKKDQKIKFINKLGIQLVEALREMHSVGYTHSDIKP
jgi:hypothetical protein